MGSTPTYGICFQKLALKVSSGLLPARKRRLLTVHTALRLPSTVRFYPISIVTTRKLFERRIIAVQPLNIDAVRAKFPAISQPGSPVFFDNPGGTQVPQSVIQAVTQCYVRTCANVGGAFNTSVGVVHTINRARLAAAALLNAPNPTNIVFGNNMTSLTFHVARAVADTIQPGDEIIVTDLDHDANVAPWLDLQAQGAVIKRMSLNSNDCTIDIGELTSLLTSRTRLLAITAASNASGTIPDVNRAVKLAKSAGALTYVDAVQFAPHRATDVQQMGCDFLVCSAYKFFGPHVGILYGTDEVLNNLPRHKVRPAPALPPSSWETGTQNHEGIAGTLAAIEHIAAPDAEVKPWNTSQELRNQIVESMSRMQSHEDSLCYTLIDALQEISGVRILGITDPARRQERLSTVSFVWDRLSPRATTNKLAERGIYCWSGNYYAYQFMKSLGMDEGAIRVGPVHYNTLNEIDQLLETLKSL